MALSPPEIRQTAERMLADYDAGRANKIFAERGTNWLTLEEAYLVQRAVAELRRQRGEHCLGYKIGRISPAIQAQFGLNEPVRGYLWEGEMLPSGSHLPVGPSAAEGRRFVNLAIEGEMAIRMARPVDSSMSLAALAQCVEHWFPVIELHNYVFRGPSATSQELVAGNAMHTGFVVPSPIREQSAPFSDVEIRIAINSDQVEVKLTSEVSGGPLGSVR